MDKIDVKKRYSNEIQNIHNILTDLKQGRIYEFTKAKMDGHLRNNIIKLEDKFNSLIDKIEHGKESNTDKASDLFKKN